MTTAAVARFRMEKDPAPGSSISAFLECLHQLLVDLELGPFVNPVGRAAFDLTEQGVANARIL